MRSRIYLGDIDACDVVLAAIHADLDEAVQAVAQMF
jgi:hypothetical protein